MLLMRLQPELRIESDFTSTAKARTRCDVSSSPTSLPSRSALRASCGKAQLRRLLFLGLDELLAQHGPRSRGRELVIARGKVADAQRLRHHVVHVSRCS